VGQVLSALCVAHCAATPLVVASAPALASVLGGFHPVLLVGVVGVALWAFVPGYRKHRRAQVPLLALAGVGLLAVATLAFHDELVWDLTLSVAGSLFMLTAHWRNRVLSRPCCTH